MEIADAPSFLAYWESVRRRTRAVADAIPERHLESDPGQGRFTPGDIVRHIASTERWMWGENVQGRPSRYPGHGPELARGRSEVLAYLERMQEETAETIGALGVRTPPLYGLTEPEVKANSEPLDGGGS